MKHAFQIMLFSGKQTNKQITIKQEGLVNCQYIKWFPFLKKPQVIRR